MKSLYLLSFLHIFLSLFLLYFIIVLFILSFFRNFAFSWQLTIMAATDKSITEKQLLADLQALRFKPVYLLTGEEDYYIDVMSDYFEDHVVPKDFADFDRTILYGRDVDMTAVINCAKRFPMMSPVQLVLVKEAQDIPAKDWEPLSAYLEHPQPQTLLVFCYRHKKLDKRSKAYKAIQSVGVVYERAKMYDNQLPSWIADQVRVHGFSITEKGAVLIAESLGNNLSKIVNELNKVFISLQPGATINEDIIERNIGISKDYNVFELQSAIGRRDVVKCNRIINHFAANPKDNPIQMILPNLYSYFIKVMMYIQVPDKGDAAAALKVSPYFIRDYEVAARNFSLGKLAACIGYLHDIDLRSKGLGNSGNTTDGELLKELVFKIIH